MKLRNPLKTLDADKAYDKMYELVLQDNFTAANKAGQHILKDYPDHEKTLLLLGQIASQRKQRPRARERYNKVLEKNTSSTPARLGRADASFGKKQYESALEDYLILYETSWKNFPYMTKLWATYAALKLDKIALKYYHRAVEIIPRDMQARFALVTHLLRLRQYKDADTQIKEAKDRYYHHKNDYRSEDFDQIQTLEAQIGRHLHRGRKKPEEKS